MARADFSPLDRIKQLDEERSRLIAEVKKEALDNANAAVLALNELGFNYRLAEGGSRRGASSVESLRKGTRTVNAERPCPICGFTTSPPHDARAHRSQGDKKRAFTAEDLSARGMTRA